MQVSSPSPPPVATRLVAVAASAGGMRVMQSLFAALPADFGAPVVVVQHRAPGSRSYLREILAAVTPLRVCDARDGDRPRRGAIYLAPPGRHVRVQAGRVLRVEDGPRLNFVRPSADLLFDSAARVYGAGALAVVLTGRGRDGASGAAEVRRRGGVVLVQDPATCEAPAMPQAVLSGCGADFALPVETLAHAMVSLVMAPSVSAPRSGLPLLPAPAG